MTLAATITPMGTAMQFSALGISTIPVGIKSKTPALASWREYQDQLPTPSQIIMWFDHPGNIGVVTGWHNLTVLDFDDRKIYDKWLWWSRRQGRQSQAASVARTAYRVTTSRGVHVYVYTECPERNRHLSGIDIKGKGGYVLGAGSIHPTGATYQELLPTMIIPTVEALSSILPSSILLEAAPVPSVPHTVTLPQSTDPWQTINDQQAPGIDLVDRIRQHWHVADMFAHTECTSHDGRWHRAKCPLHDDGDPSFWIDTQREIGGCFSGCTPKPVDVINLYARITGLTNRDAILTLARAL